MNLDIFKGALSAVKTKAAPVIFQLRKHAPEILVGVGVTSVAGGTVLACKATLDAKDILSEEIVTEVYQGVDEEGNDVYNLLDESDIRKEQVKKGLQVAGKYAPAAGLLLGGTAMLIGAKSIEHRRLVTALGAYSTLEGMFETYRGRIISEHGPAADARALSGETVEKFDVYEEQEEGKKPKKSKVELVTRTRTCENPYHRIFDGENSPYEWNRNLEENKEFLRMQQTFLNQKLKAEGRVFLSDVYEALGFEYEPITRLLGWLADDIVGSKDGFIDFGIDYAYLAEEVGRALDERRSPEPSIWLNFNCDGLVYDKELVKKHDN